MNTVEETLVLIKPDGVARNLTGEILRRIEAKGYQLVDIRLVQADLDLLEAARTAAAELLGAEDASLRACAARHLERWLGSREELLRA